MFKVLMDKRAAKSRQLTTAAAGGGTHAVAVADAGKGVAKRAKL